jgi:hypothetical protein
MIATPTLALYALCYALAFAPACRHVETNGANANATTPAAAVFFDAEPAPDQTGDDALASARRLDAQNRQANGELQNMSPQEHMRRAAI